MPPPRLIKRAELALIIFIVVIFALSAIECGAFAFDHMKDSSDFTYVFASIICMTVAGLGLILLLLAKLYRLHLAGRERKKIMGLLVPRMAALEASMDGIGLVDAEGKLTYLNKALLTLHGLDERDLPDYIGQPWSALYSPKGRQDIREKVMPHLEKFGNWQGVAPIIRKGGGIVYAEMSLTLLEDGGLIGTARDITERQRAEREKEEWQRQFFQSQKMEAIGRLAGGVAHDFNNILASMLGFAGFLLEDLDSGSEHHHFAGQIMIGGLQAQHLIEQILAFSRPEDTELEIVDLVNAASLTADMLKSTMPSSIALEVDIDIAEAYIAGNPTRISQALMNLCVNAIDAMNRERGRLSITLAAASSEDLPFPEVAQIDCDAPQSPCENAKLVQLGSDKESGETLMQCGALAQGKQYVCLEVSDTGCGIPRAVMEHMFEPFFTTKPIGQGSGLGLSSVHGIVMGHGGAMVVRSTPRAGTSFALYFPLTEYDQGQAVIRQRSKTKAATSARILIVEDGDSIREMHEKMVIRIGYEVESCADGDIAVDILRERPGYFDLVITDYTMPNMSGTELAQEIAGDFPGLPVILLSGYSDRRLQHLAAESPNILHVLRKPVSAEILAEYIQSALIQGKVFNKTAEDGQAGVSCR